jgi:hypothetical protein
MIMHDRSAPKTCGSAADRVPERSGCDIRRGRSVGAACFAARVLDD